MQVVKKYSTLCGLGTTFLTNHMRKHIHRLLFVALLALPTHAIGQSLASANFSTYNLNAELVGQNGWAQVGSNAVNPLFVSPTGVVALPGGPAVDGQDAFLAFSEIITPPTEGTTSIELNALINVTAAGANPSYFLAIQGGTFANARIVAKASGNGYVLGVRVTGQSGYPFVYGTQEFVFGTLVHIRAMVDLVAGAANDQIALYAGTNPNQLALQAISIYTTGSIPTDPSDYNAVIISQFGSGTVQQSGVAISSLRVTKAAPVSIEDESDRAISMMLDQNYPNPFNPSTVIGFQLAVAGEASLKVYDVLGREVAVLVDGMMSAGQHQATFNADGLPSGMYLVRLEAGGQVMTRKMSLVK